MPRCACGGDTTCACLIVGSDTVQVEGLGTTASPYEISTTSPLMPFVVADTATVDLSLVGTPGPNEAATLSAVATLKMTDLLDVDHADVPASGDIPVWDGTKWVFQPPAAASTPVSGVWGTAPLDVYGTLLDTGQTTYLDSAGKIRARPQVIYGPEVNRLAADSIDRYPVGVSVLTLSSAQATAGAWPSGSATVLTVRRYDTDGTLVGYQEHVTNSASPIKRIRTWTGAAWGAWREELGADTGWLNFTITGTGWTVPGGGVTWQARQIGNRVYIRGMMQNSTFTGSAVVATLPAAITPPPFRCAVTAMGSAAVFRDAVLAGTDLTVMTDGTSSAFWAFTGSYLTD